MRKTFVTTLLLATSVSQADIIKCHFTEPFVTSTYSTDKSTLTYEDWEQKVTVLKNVAFQIKSAGVFELISEDGKVLQTLILNNEGSDGMSDINYPFQAKDNTEETNKGIGGCTSNYLKSTDSKK